MVSFVAISFVFFYGTNVHAERTGTVLAFFTNVDEQVWVLLPSQELRLYWR